MYVVEVPFTVSRWKRAGIVLELEYITTVDIYVVG